MKDAETDDNRPHPGAHPVLRRLCAGVEFGVGFERAEEMNRLTGMIIGVFGFSFLIAVVVFMVYVMDLSK